MRKASERANKVRDNQSLFWDLFRVLINNRHVQATDQVKLTGAARARDLKTISALCEERCGSAVQDQDADKYYAYASIKASFAKSELFNPGKLGDERALAAWMRAERECRRANIRLALTRQDIIGKQYYKILERARRIVLDILEEQFPWEQLPQACRHGPGVAIGVAGLATSGAFKYAASVYTVTPACSSIFRHMILTDPVWRHLCEMNHTRVDWVDDVDKLQFVTKNWHISRSIGIGPLGNLYCQLGAGELIAQRLRLKAGIDIRDQTSNQRAAFVASLNSGNYGDSPVTVDLRSASDTMCRMLVKWLFPESWYRVLNCMRTAGTVLPTGDIVRNQKFSAMGNGFTFPVQTLIFYAISRAVVSCTQHSGQVLAYGDDIIVPRGAALLLTEVLRWCGFTVNSEKSYIHGAFYESCGTDYLGGIPVRPVYWKRNLRSDRDLYDLINRYAKHLSATPSRVWICDLRDHLIRSCRKPILYGPKVGEVTQFRFSKLISFSPDLYECDDRVVTEDRSLYTMKRKQGILYAKVFKTKTGKQLVSDDFAYLQARHGFGSGMCDTVCDLTLVATESKGAAKSQSIRLSYTDGTRWISVS